MADTAEGRTRPLLTAFPSDFKRLHTSFIVEVTSFKSNMDLKAEKKRIWVKTRPKIVVVSVYFLLFWITPDLTKVHKEILSW